MLARHRGPVACHFRHRAFTSGGSVCARVLHAVLVSPAIDTILRRFFISRLDLNAKIKKKKEEIPGYFLFPLAHRHPYKTSRFRACRAVPGIHYCLSAGVSSSRRDSLDYFNIRSCRCLFINACLRRVSWFSTLLLLFVSTSQSQLFDLKLPDLLHPCTYLHISNYIDVLQVSCITNARLGYHFVSLCII